MKKIYLAYGSNLNLGQMGMRCPDALVIGTTLLKDYQLIFKGSHNSGVASIEKKVGSSVPVLLWEITKRCEKALDRYEGFPHLYRKEYLKVLFEDQQLIVMAYVMNEGPPLSAPGTYYFKTIIDGYYDCGFDEEILNNAVDYTLEALG